MTRPVLVVRPQPGADATAERARARGLEAIVAPIFRIAPRAWTLPDRPCEALLVTSANTARLLDDRVDRALPVYAVGAATASALGRAGFTNVIVGDDGVEQIVAMAETALVGSLLHLAGEDRTEFRTGSLRVETRIVYAAEPCAPSPDFDRALAAGAIVLLHSVRAAIRFRELTGPGHGVVAISPAVLAAAGDGWARAVNAEHPTDDALLAAAARLCQ